MMRSLKSWQKNCELMKKDLYRRYSKAWNDHNCSDNVRNYYSTIANNYHNLDMLLQHFIEAGSWINKKSCAFCQDNDQQHMKSMNDLYNKYAKFINRSIDCRKYD